MRQPHEVVPAPQTREEVLVHGLAEIAHMAPGGRLTPSYNDLRRVKDYAAGILEQAQA